MHSENKQCVIKRNREVLRIKLLSVEMKILTGHLKDTWRTKNRRRKKVKPNSETRNIRERIRIWGTNSEEPTYS